MSEEQSKEKQEISKECTPSDIIEKEQQVEQVTEVVRSVIRSEFSGPIPPPEILTGYENILPGATDRILKMAEKQSDHRQSMEKIRYKAESRDSLLGVMFAFLLGIGCITGCIVVVMNVPNTAGALSGTVLGATGVGTIAATFIKNTRIHQKTDNK